jgi:HlyD family secretion protein
MAFIKYQRQDMLRAIPIVLIGCLSLGLSSCSDSLTSQAAQASDIDDAPRDLPDYLSVERVERGMLRDIIPAVGRIRAADQVDVGAEVSGRVVEVLVDYDDQVAAGDVLARLDQAPFEAALNRAEAQLATARASQAEALARLQASELELGRAQTLAEARSGPQSRVEDLRLVVAQQRAGVDRARAQVSLAESQLVEARINLDRSVITAPRDGFVLDRRVEVGQSVNAALSTPVIFVIASNLEQVVIEAEVAEADVARIEAGMDVRFTVDAYPGVRFIGDAGAVRRSPTINNRFVTYVVPIQASDPEQRLLPGMTASVEFVAAEALNELLVPRASRSVGVPLGFVVPQEIDEWVRERHAIPSDQPLLPDMMGSVFGAMLGRAAREGQAIVFVWEDGASRVRHVRIGPEDDNYFAAVDGQLEVGDWVIVDSRDPAFEDL